MVKETSNRTFGSIGEQTAASFLTEKGFTIIAHNFRFGKTGEIDLIARKGDLVVFVEVKNRRSEKFGGAYYSVSKKKLHAIKATAQYYIASHMNNEKVTFRFDTILMEKGMLSWIEDSAR